MSLVEQHRETRRSRTHAATRAAILNAARRVAARDGARDLSLRAVAAEAGYAPAALYGYFANKDELLLALAAEDLSGLTRAMRDEMQIHGGGKLTAAAAVALDLLENTETFAAVSSAFPANAGSSDTERLFNGRMIAALRALSEASGLPSDNRESQCDVVLVAAAIAGMALLERSGRLGALGFQADEILASNTSSIPLTRRLCTQGLLADVNRPFRMSAASSSRAADSPNRRWLARTSDMAARRRGSRSRSSITRAAAIPSRRVCSASAFAPCWRCRRAASSAISATRRLPPAAFAKVRASARSLSASLFRLRSLAICARCATSCA